MPSISIDNKALTEKISLFCKIASAKSNLLENNFTVTPMP